MPLKKLPFSLRLNILVLNFNHIDLLYATILKFESYFAKCLRFVRFCNPKTIIYELKIIRY